ncbi:MAG TPA: LysE family transporter, partial [Spirochaetia bacterium]|nr:LysE family transporter [Spirochaetia bacterium]
FSLSFIMSLSGALMPGPMLTYTVARTVQAGRKGWLLGPRVVIGHAALEAVLLLCLVLGVVEFLHAPVGTKIIGVVGALLLAWMGIGLIREAVRGRALDLHDSSTTPGPRASGTHPALAGTLVSLSNPYFWIWWITIGSAFLLRFNVTIERWQALLAFYLGHELGDFGWYTAVSTILHLGRRTISAGVTTIILGVCGVVLIGFGVFLGVSPFLSR